MIKTIKCKYPKIFGVSVYLEAIGALSLSIVYYLFSVGRIYNIYISDYGSILFFFYSHNIIIFFHSFSARNKQSMLGWAHLSYIIY